MSQPHQLETLQELITLWGHTVQAFSEPKCGSTVKKSTKSPLYPDGKLHYGRLKTKAHELHHASLAWHLAYPLVCITYREMQEELCTEQSSPSDLFPAHAALVVGGTDSDSERFSGRFLMDWRWPHHKTWLDPKTRPHSARLQTMMHHQPTSSGSSQLFWDSGLQAKPTCTATSFTAESPCSFRC